MEGAGPPQIARVDYRTRNLGARLLERSPQMVLVVAYVRIRNGVLEQVRSHRRKDRRRSKPPTKVNRPF